MLWWRIAFDFCWRSCCSFFPTEISIYFTEVLFDDRGSFCRTSKFPWIHFCIFFFIVVEKISKPPTTWFQTLCFNEPRLMVVMPLKQSIKSLTDLLDWSYRCDYIIWNHLSRTTLKRAYEIDRHFITSLKWLTHNFPYFFSW